MHITMRNLRAICAPVLFLLLATPVSAEIFAGAQKDQQIEFDYRTTESVASAGAAACTGGPLAQAVDCVTRTMDSDSGNAGESSHSALAAIPVTPILAREQVQTDTNPLNEVVFVTLQARTGSIDHIADFAPAEQAKLRRDLFLAKRHLDGLRVDLTASQARQLLHDEKPITIRIDDGWDVLSLLKPTQTQITINPPNQGLTPEELRNAYRENRTINLRVVALDLVEDKTLPLTISNSGKDKATGIKLEFKPGGTLCPYAGGCEGEYDGLPKVTELCPLGGESEKSACSECKLDVQLPELEKFLYGCPDAELEPGTQAEFRFTLDAKPKAQQSEGQDDEHPVMVAEPISECREWPRLSVIVSANEKDSDPSDNTTSAPSPGFGPAVTGLQFRLIPPDKYYDVVADAKATTEAEIGDSVYLQANIDRAPCGSVGADPKRPLAYALVKSAAEDHDIQVPLHLSDDGSGVLRSRSFKTADFKYQSLPVMVEAWSEGKTAKLTVYPDKQGLGVPRRLKFRSVEDERYGPEYYETPNLTIGRAFLLRLEFDDRYPGYGYERSVRLELRRAGRLVASKFVTVNATGSSFPGQSNYSSGSLTADFGLFDADILPNDELRAIYDEKDNGKKVRPRSIEDTLPVAAADVVVDKVELLTGGNGATRRITTDGVFQAQVSFTTPPYDKPQPVDLRVVRAGNTIKELVETLSWLDREKGIASSGNISLADDRRFGALVPGDRIEARYADGKWTSALEVVGRPGKVTAITFEAGGKAVDEVAVGTPFTVVVRYEAPSKGDKGLTQVGLKTQGDFTDREFTPSSRQHRMIMLRADKADPARMITRPIVTAGAGQAPTGTDLFVLPGYTIEATAGGMNRQVRVVAASKKADEATLLVTAKSGYGHDADLRATASDGRSRPRSFLTNHEVNLPAGQYDLRVQLLLPYEIPVQLVAGKKKTVQVPAADLGTLYVDLKDGTGNSVAPLSVFVDKKTKGPQGWKDQIGTSHSGENRIDLPRGTYHFSVSAADGNTYQFKNQVIKGGEVTHVQGGQDLGRLKVLLRDVDGKPVNVACWVTLFNRGTTNGKFLHVPAGRQSVTIDTAVGTMLVGADIEAGKDRTVKASLARLNIVALDSHGKPDAGAPVALYESAFQSKHDKRIWSGKPGAIDLAPGTYQVYFDRTQETLPVELKQGEQRTVRQKGALGRLVVTLGSGAASADKRYELSGGEWSSVHETPALGSTVELKPGRYRAIVPGGTGSNMTYTGWATVSAGKTTTLELGGGGTIVIRDPLAGKRTAKLSVYLQKLVDGRTGFEYFLHEYDSTAPVRSLNVPAGDYRFTQKLDGASVGGNRDVTVKAGGVETITLSK